MPIKINVKTRIKFNGQEYDGVESMPPEVRQIFEQLMAGKKVVIHTTGKITFNGQEYANLEAMPADVRQQYQQIMGTFDKDGNGIPDMLEGATQTPPASGSTDAFAESAPLIPQPVAPSKRAPSTFSVILIGLVVVLGLAAVGLLLVVLYLR